MNAKKSVIFLYMVFCGHILITQGSSLILSGFLLLHAVIIHLRERRKVSRRENGETQKNIKKSLDILTARGVLIHQPQKRLKYVGYIGYNQPSQKPPKVTLFLKAGMHGLEYFSIQILLGVLLQIRPDHIDWLKKNKIQIIVVPIVNWYGFENYTRTNKNRVDLARNYETYLSPLRKKMRPWPFLVGWGFKTFLDWLTIPIALPLAYIFMSTDYFKGFRVQKEILELKEILDPLMKSQSTLYAFDCHTGNPEIQTVVWGTEFDPRNIGELGFFKKLLRKFNTRDTPHEYKFAQIDYPIDGALFEALAYENNQYSANLFTIEFPTHSQSNTLYALYRYFLDTGYEPYNRYRKSALNREILKMTTMIEYILNDHGVHIATIKF